MNGDSKEIFEKIVSIEVKQEERHRENKQDLAILFKKIDKINTQLNNLPCAAHDVMLKALFAVFGIGIISALLTALIRKAIANA